MARPAKPIGLSVLLALAFTLVGLSVSFNVPCPVSLFITTLAFATCLGVRLYDRLAKRQRLFHRPEKG